MRTGRVFLLACLVLSAAGVAAAQHAGGCACGMHQLSHPTWELDLVTSGWRNAASVEFGKWHTYIDPFGWTVGDDFAGDNGKNEILFFGIATTYSVYGILIDSDVFGVTFLDPKSAFGTPSFNGCPPPSGTTCGYFTETDVIMNADFGRGWTTAPPNFSDTGPANFGATALHELGHGLGLHHNFDNLSTMNYFEDFATVYLSRADARIARLHFSGSVQTVDDVAIYPFRYTGSGSGYSSTVVASPSVSSVAAGSSFTLRDFTIENVGSTTLSNVRYRFFLSSNTFISESDYLLGTLEWSSFSSWWDTSGQVFAVPAGVPAGTYYVGALVYHDTNSADSVTYNNSWVLDDARKITVTVAADPDLVVTGPSVSDASLSPGQSFTASATVKNQGTGSSASTTLRYYRSPNSIISTGDVQIGTDAVGALSPGGTSFESAGVTAPGEGSYYIGACVDTVAGESNSGNNCSSGVPITVASTTTCESVQLNGTTLSGTSSHLACNTLSAGPSLILTGTSNVTLEAGKAVVFFSGFKASSGASLAVRSCGQDLCSAGAAMRAGCNSCVSTVCAADSFCCDTSWDTLCVGEVDSICGLTCP